MIETRNVHAAIGALLGLLGVGLGAFGAHGLEGHVEGVENAAERLEWWGTAAHYQLVHAVAIVAIAACLADPRARRVPTIALTLGVVLFSGTLYAMALGAPTKLGAVTPIGGLLLMVGWIAAGLAFLRRPAA